MKIRITDPNDNEGKGSVEVYTVDNFRSWVHEVFLEGYKREVPFPGLFEAISLVEAKGCKVEFVDDKTT